MAGAKPPVRQYSRTCSRTEFSNSGTSDTSSLGCLCTTKRSLQTNDDLLPHVLFGDFTRFVIEAWRSGDSDLLGRCLDFLERALLEGDEKVLNLVEASFIENVGVWDPVMAPFVETWPNALRAQAERQSGNR